MVGTFVMEELTSLIVIKILAEQKIGKYLGILWPAIFDHLTLIWVGFLGVHFQVGGEGGVKLPPPPSSV